MPDKTIFILGAGFSAPARVPTQGALLGKVLNQNVNDKLTDFIQRVFGLDHDQASDLALEDVYTAIHKAVARNQAIKGYNSESLKRLEILLTQRISHAINVEVDPELEATSYLAQFIRYLQGGARTNSFGVVSLNWDILLDRRLGVTGHGNERTYIDYGTHCTGIGNDDDRVKPALLAKNDQDPVVPLLKLHGSLNWLVCPQCERLYVNWNRKIALEEHPCRACGQDEIQLQPSIILPTFQKALDSFHFQHIWNQAARELSRATKLVFLGYSFPLADFDFRALVTKHVSTNTEVEVVLRQGDDQNGTGARYKNYFGGDRCTIRYDGVEAYVASLTEQSEPAP